MPAAWASILVRMTPAAAAAAASGRRVCSFLHPFHDTFKHASVDAMTESGEAVQRGLRPERLQTGDGVDTHLMPHHTIVLAVQQVQAGAGGRHSRR